VLVPVAEIRGPAIRPGGRGLVLERLRPILAAIARDEALPPVPIYRGPEGPQAVLLDGAHRFSVSVAFGFQEIPCLHVERQDAEVLYGYPDGQR